MLIKPPRSRISARSRFRDSIARTREKYYALFSVLVVKIALFISLCVLFGSSLRAFSKSSRNIGQFWRVVFPIMIICVALFIGYHIFKNIKEIRQLERELKNRS